MAGQTDPLATMTPDEYHHVRAVLTDRGLWNRADSGPEALAIAEEARKVLAQYRRTKGRKA